MPATPTTLLSAANAPGDGPVLSLRTARSRDDFIVQIDITGSASVEIYGRVSRRLGFHLLAAVTSDAIIPITRVAEVFARVITVTGTVDAEIYVDE
jgi:hypothetical protein